VRDSSIILFAAGCVTSISLKIAFPSFVNTMPAFEQNAREVSHPSKTSNHHPTPIAIALGRSTISER
jgi:hypothetical protein